MPRPVLIRGGGEMATGVACTLYRAGLHVVMLETSAPRAIRRGVAFAEAVFNGRHEVENIVAERVGADGVDAVCLSGRIAVVVDPDAEMRSRRTFPLLVDAIMSKHNAGRTAIEWAPLVIGLGPGFWAGRDCHLVVETNRGHHLGRFYDRGPAERDTGAPGDVAGQTARRVVRAPTAGTLKPQVAIGTRLRAGDLIARIGSVAVIAPLGGVLRGIMREGLSVGLGEKIADIDPRGRPEYCRSLSDKSRQIGLGVLGGLLWWECGRPGPLYPNPNLPAA